MKTKIVNLDDNTYLTEGEPLIVPFVLSSRGYEPDTRFKAVGKSASCEEAQQFAATITPQEGRRVILVSAMGSAEVWGPNKKGDVFPENGLLNKHPVGIDPERAFAKYASRIPRHWGYTCFPTKFDTDGNQIGGGNTFHEHENRVRKTASGNFPDRKGPKSPADPRCGYILGSFWNTKMARVELIQEVWEHRLPNLIRAIDDGFMPGISMACDIPFDRCSKCANLAPSDWDYCEHLDRKFGRRGTVDADGTPLVMINDYPVLFDSSIVDRPACVTGKTLQKVASFALGGIPKKEPEVKREETALNPWLLSKIDSIQTLRSQEMTFGEKAASLMRPIPLSRLLRYLGVLGMVPTGGDLARIGGMPGVNHASLTSLIESLLHGHLTNKVHVGKDPHITIIIKSASDEENSPTWVDEEWELVSDIAIPYMPHKSYFPSYLLQRRSFSKSASTTLIDISGPLDKLDPQVRRLLLLRIIMDDGLRHSLSELLKSATIREEIERKTGGSLGDGGIGDLSMIPLYDTRPTYIGALEHKRVNQFLGQ